MSEGPRPERPITDEWIDEPKEIEHNVVEFNPKTGQISHKKEKTIEKIPTRYASSSESIITCAVGDHEWFMEDRHRHVAACTKCPKHRFLRAVYERIENGHIYDRDTGTLID